MTNSNSEVFDAKMSNKRVRKRGPRKPQLPKPLRDLLKRARVEQTRKAAQEDTEEEEVLSSIESDYNDEESRKPKSWQALEEELNTLQAEESEDEREVSWSISPEPTLNGAGECFSSLPSLLSSLVTLLTCLDVRFPLNEVDDAQQHVEEEDEQIVEADDDSSVQPFGDRCIVICRLSSSKMEPKSASLITNAQRQEAHRERRREEGRELARRLASNCPTPVVFSEVFATCHKRRGTERTNWQATVPPISAMVTDIGGWFKRPCMRGSKVTVLIRAVDGITLYSADFKSFLLLLKAQGVIAQLIFQYNKVYNEIRPLRLRNFRGLGGTADFMAADFLAHLDGTRDDPAVARILEIWQHVDQDKTDQAGIQDRNGLLPADAVGPIDGNAARQAGRN